MSELEPQVLFYFFVGLVVLLSIIVVWASIFSALMLRDCVRRNLPSKNKWLAVITVLNVAGAILYYWRVKRHFE